MIVFLSVARAQYSILPSAFSVLAYDEDYSYLADPAARTNTFDRVKYIPLGDRTNSYLSLGAQVRDRYEIFPNDLFGTEPVDKSGYNLVRVLAHADLHLGPVVRVFVQGINATVQGREGGPRPTDENELDLYEAFVDIKIPLAEKTSLTLRGGRQVIVFGAERLIGVSDWTNVRRNWDGVRGTLATEENTLDGFYARQVRVLPHEFDDDVPDTHLAGLYNTWKVPGALAKAKTKLDTYALYVNRGSITFNRTTAGENRYTLGSRISGKLEPFDFDLEAAYQIGRFNFKTTHSFAAVGIGGYTLTNATFTPRFFLGANIASGGQRDNPGNTFDQLFPSGHDRFGIIDAIGWQNIIDVHPGVILTLLENKPAVESLQLLVEYRQFWRESIQDAVYTSSGTVLRADGRSSARAIGGEIDLQVNWQLDRYLNFYAGYSRFFPGAFISETGPHNDVNFAYAAIIFRF
jgi:Alginate export